MPMRVIGPGRSSHDLGDVIVSGPAKGINWKCHEDLVWKSVNDYLSLPFCCLLLVQWRLYGTVGWVEFILEGRF